MKTALEKLQEVVEEESMMTMKGLHFPKPEGKNQSSVNINGMCFHKDNQPYIAEKCAEVLTVDSLSSPDKVSMFLNVQNRRNYQINYVQMKESYRHILAQSGIVGMLLTTASTVSLMTRLLSACIISFSFHGSFLQLSAVAHTQCFQTFKETT